MMAAKQCPLTTPCGMPTDENDFWMVGVGVKILEFGTTGVLDYQWRYAWPLDKSWKLHVGFYEILLRK